jgi:hypothetical protein
LIRSALSGDQAGWDDQLETGASIVLNERKAPVQALAEGFGDG